MALSLRSICLILITIETLTTGQSEETIQPFDLSDSSGWTQDNSDNIEWGECSIYLGAGSTCMKTQKTAYIERYISTAGYHSMRLVIGIFISIAYISTSLHQLTHSYI